MVTVVGLLNNWLFDIQSCLDYSSPDWGSRNLLSKALKEGSELCKLYSTRFLGILIRSKTPNIAQWGIELLVSFPALFTIQWELQFRMIEIRIHSKSESIRNPNVLKVSFRMVKNKMAAILFGLQMVRTIWKPIKIASLGHFLWKQIFY